MQNNIITARAIPAKELPLGQTFTLEPGSDDRLRLIGLRAVEFDKLGKPTAFSMTGQRLDRERRSDETVTRITPNTKIYPVNHVIPQRLRRVAVITRDGSVDERDDPTNPAYIDLVQLGEVKDGVMLRILAKVVYHGDYYHDQYIEINLSRATGGVIVHEYATTTAKSFIYTACGNHLLHWQSEAIIKAAVEMGRSYWDRWE